MKLTDKAKIIAFIEGNIRANVSDEAEVLRQMEELHDGGGSDPIGQPATMYVVSDEELAPVYEYWIDPVSGDVQAQECLGYADSFK